MMTTIVSALTAEKAEGIRHAEECAERINRHIRDLEMLRAWILDSSRARAAAIDALIGNNPPAAATND